MQQLHRWVDTVADYTVGTVIVMVYMMVADRQERRRRDNRR